MTDDKPLDPPPDGFVRDINKRAFRSRVYNAIERKEQVVFKDRYTNEVQFLKEIFEVETHNPHERFYLVVEGYEENGTHFFYEDYISEWEDWQIYLPSGATE